MTKASDLFIQCLEEEALNMVFRSGEENLDFLGQSVAFHQDQLILTRQ